MEAKNYLLQSAYATDIIVYNQLQSAFSRINFPSPYIDEVILYHAVEIELERQIKSNIIHSYKTLSNFDVGRNLDRVSVELKLSFIDIYQVSYTKYMKFFIHT